MEPTTTLEVLSDDFKIECPHCGHIQERIYIGGRAFDPEIMCDGDCGGLIVLEINALPG